VPDATVTRRSFPPVAHHQPPTIPVELVAQRANVLIDLGLERRGDHPPRTLPREIVEPDPTHICPLDREPANILHGVPSCRPTPASV